MPSRIARESKTVAVMIADYCRAHHQGNGICPGCKELKDYALKRLEKCIFREGKTVCSKCPVHCFKPDMRESIQNIMRYAGPRMMYRHPVMAIFHIIDSGRKEPVKAARDK